MIDLHQYCCADGQLIDGMVDMLVKFNVSHPELYFKVPGRQKTLEFQVPELHRPQSGKYQLQCPYLSRCPGLACTVQLKILQSGELKSERLRWKQGQGESNQ